MGLGRPSGPCRFILDGLAGPYILYLMNTTQITRRKVDALDYFEALNARNNLRNGEILAVRRSDGTFVNWDTSEEFEPTVRDIMRSQDGIFIRTPDGRRP